MHISTLLTGAGLISLGIAGYTLDPTDDYTSSADGFWSKFKFETADDPTKGYVNYVDQGAAQAGGLIKNDNGKIYIGVDHSNVASGRGRNSVRLSSTKAYNHGLVIIDLDHMPGSICALWPAFWMTGQSWPNNGEIDIIEGVNDGTLNTMTLHTNAGCSIRNDTGFAGKLVTPGCDVNDPRQFKNQGCSIGSTSSSSYGTGFNAGRGGIYATEWTSQHIKIWFWPRGQIPADIASGTPNPSGWNSPQSVFQGDCNIDDHFRDNNIIFDTTFCGSWAGEAFKGSSCAQAHGGDCNAFVRDNPQAFKEAFWSVNSLKVYQDNGPSPNRAAQPAQAPPKSPEPAKPSVVASPPAQTAAAADPTTSFVATVYVTAAPTPTPAQQKAQVMTVSALQSNQFGHDSSGIPSGWRRKRHAHRMLHAARGQASE